MLLQKHVGVHDQMAQWGPKLIRDFMPEQHRNFYAQLPFIIAAAVNADGQVWAGILTGQPGFISSPDPQNLLVDGHDIDAVRHNDPLLQALRDNDAIGILGIELHSRRRNRVNGRADLLDDGRLAVRVEHSFGNCPRYIQARGLLQAPDMSAGGGDVVGLDHMDMAAREMVRRSDTFFVGSYAILPDGNIQVDASHRGGFAGFVRVQSDGRLIIPDFAGNRFFNTLGNIVLTGRAGLTFVDFENGDMLQMTGKAGLVSDDVDVDFPGAERFWWFQPEIIVRREGGVGLTGSFSEYSPHLEGTGYWTG